MILRYTSLTFLFTVSTGLFAQTIWSGPVITFTKTSFADWTQQQNQDRITGNVWITRADSMGIFNIAQESGFEPNVSPAGTEWAFGTTADIGSLTFTDWKTAVNNDPPSSVAMPMVLHLIADDIYIDLEFQFWTQSAAGGGFSYTRSTDANAVEEDVITGQGHVLIGPNPCRDGSITVRVSGKGDLDVQVLDPTGGRVSERHERPGAGEHVVRIDLGDRPAGIYFVRVMNGDTHASTYRVVLTGR
ncbi:MAG: T9SS type A sorting domain-containing protein [Flavobacteriales bacterium]|nr:T9SS type A sorting domain-containing protein [Flavobacteriales bacterium]MCB9166256.1 T9SS type A sorting domain-containing protein [Flavobacteriales bacterium]